MKYKFLFFLTTLFLFFACAPTRKPVKEAKLDGGWVLAVFPHENKTLSEVFGARIIELEFDKTTKKVSGTTGCNRFTGNYTAAADTLTFSENRALTKMACPDYDEQLFLHAIDRVNRYRLIEGQLELMQNTDIIMIFARKL